MRSSQHLDGSETIWEPPAEYRVPRSLAFRWIYEDHDEGPEAYARLDVEVILQHVDLPNRCLRLLMHSVWPEATLISVSVLKGLKIADIRRWQWSGRNYLAMASMDSYDDNYELEFCCGSYEVEDMVND